GAEHSKWWKSRLSAGTGALTLGSTAIAAHHMRHGTLRARAGREQGHADRAMQDAVDRELREPDFAAAGERIYALAAELYPICRSITGNGVRTTLGLMRRHVPLQVHEVPTGTQLFDWKAPKEWNIRAAYIKAPDGSTVV